MKRNKIVFVGSLVAVAVVSNIHGRIRQHQKTVKVMDGLTDEIMVMFRAYIRLRDRAASGKINTTDPDRIKEELEFEIIAAREE